VNDQLINLIFSSAISPLKVLKLSNRGSQIIKSPSVKCQRAGNSRLPLLESFRTFKGNTAIENVRLNQLINTPISIINSI